MINIGDIKARRLACVPKISIKELAECSGLSVGFVRAIETDPGCNWTRVKIEALLSTLALLEGSRDVSMPVVGV